MQLIDATSLAVLDATVSDDSGNYSLAVNPQTDVFVRVRAELKNTSPVWDVEVRDNVDLDPNPPALADRPIYVMDSAVFNSGDQGQIQDLTAATGWDLSSSSFTEVRAAAPFSVLDAIYSAMTLITTVDPSASFPPLDAFWSPDNVSTRGAGTTEENVASGEIGTSFYSGGRLFLLGKDGDDIEEFDDHVIVHEWGHYFEDNFSRSDSIGGAHGLGDSLDMRLAFGEGFATALSGMALNNRIYCDTSWFAGNLSGFEIDIESEFAGTAGWFNEISVMKLIYDLWDTNVDGADNSSIGFAPIYDVMTGPQLATPAVTSIFSFATDLKLSLNAQDNAFVDALLAEQSINPNIDTFGSTELNDGPGMPDDVLPIYDDLVLGVTRQICTNSQFDSGRDGNKLSEHRFLKLNLPVSQQVTFSMITLSPPSMPAPDYNCVQAFMDDDPEVHVHSDPDFYVYLNGSLMWVGGSCVPNTEVSPTNGALPAGDYVIDLNEFRHEDEDSPGGFPEQVCFDFTAN